MRQGLNMSLGLSCNSLYRPDCPRTHRSACLCLPSDGNKGVCHYVRLNSYIFNQWRVPLSCISFWSSTLSPFLTLSLHTVPTPTPAALLKTTASEATFALWASTRCSSGVPASAEPPTLLSPPRCGDFTVHQPHHSGPRTERLGTILHPTVSALVCGQRPEHRACALRLSPARERARTLQGSQTKGSRARKIFRVQLAGAGACYCRLDKALLWSHRLVAAQGWSLRGGRRGPGARPMGREGRVAAASPPCARAGPGGSRGVRPGRRVRFSRQTQRHAQPPCQGAAADYAPGPCRACVGPGRLL